MMSKTATGALWFSSTRIVRPLASTTFLTPSVIPARADSPTQANRIINEARHRPARNGRLKIVCMAIRVSLRPSTLAQSRIRIGSGRFQIRAPRGGRDGRKASTRAAAATQPEIAWRAATLLLCVSRDPYYGQHGGIARTGAARNQGRPDQVHADAVSAGIPARRDQRRGGSLSRIPLPAVCRRGHLFAAALQQFCQSRPGLQLLQGDCRASGGPP